MSGNDPTQPGPPPGWQPPPQHAKAWQQPPPPAAPPSWDYPPPGAGVQPPPPRKSRGWVTWVIALAAFGLGLAVGGGVASDPEATTARTVTVTSIVERTVQVPVTTTEPEAPTTEAPTTTRPKPATTSPPAATIEEGEWAVPSEVKPGTYRTTGGEGCYWARLKGFSGDLDDVIANGLPSGPARVTIARTDKGFTTSGCAPWRKVG